jgi:hypothetical protein
VTDTITAAALSAVAVVAVVVAVLLKLAVDSRPSPGETVTRYLSAISAGDAETANQLFDPAAIEPRYLPTGRSDATSFTTPLALMGATERISDLEITRVARATRAATASVFYRYLIAGEQVDGALALRWGGERWQLLTGVWQLLQVRPVFVPADLAPASITVALGSAVAVCDRDFGHTGSFIAYPGVYSVTLDAPGWVADGPDAPPKEARLVAPTSAAVLRPRFRQR